METKDDKYDFIDFTKFFFMLCVIGIHTNIYELSYSYGWYILHCIFHLGVPFFFVASGFFFMAKLEKSGGGLEQTVKSYIKRILVPLLFYVALNISLDVFLKIINNYQFSVKWFIRTFQKILFDPPGAMWFLSACFYGIIFLVPFIKYNKINYALVIGIFLYIFALTSNIYHYLVKDYILLNRLIDLWQKFFITTRNGLFIAFFELALGIKAYDFHKKKKDKIFIFFIPLFFLILFIESYYAKLNRSNIKGDGSMFFIIPFLAQCIFLLSLNIKIKFKYSKLLRNLSSGMYFMHTFVLSIISIGLVHFTPVFADSPIIKFLLTTFISFLICIIGYKVNNKRINLLIK